METYNETTKSNSEERMQKENFCEWAKVHKKEFVYAGISVIALVGIIAGIKNKQSIEAQLKLLKRSATNTPFDKNVARANKNMDSFAETISTADPYSPLKQRKNTVEFDVTDHIRNLHEGWNASREKIVEAKAHGIELLPGQTWVKNHTKGVIAA